jgi:hypothetical protein
MLVCFCMPKLKVGDTVWWRGSWGSEAPKRTVVKRIELSDRPRSKEGEIVQEVDWDKKDYILVSLDNGHWAYGNQLEPCSFLW